MREPSTSIGLALGGGAARGAAHIGVLKALENHHLKPFAISGTSIGALIGALYAFDIPIDTIYEQAQQMNWLKISRLKLSKLGLLSNHEIGEIIEKFIGHANIEDARIPLAIVATDIGKGEKVVFRKGNVAQAVMASTCIPGIFAPTQIDGRILVDGFLVENVPVSPLREMGVNVVIAVVLGSPRVYHPPDNLLEVIMNSFEIAIDQLTRKALQEADVVIAPNLSTYSRSDVEHIPDLYAEGYRATEASIHRIHKIIQKKRRPASLWERLKSWLKM